MFHNKPFLLLLFVRLNSNIWQILLINTLDLIEELPHIHDIETNHLYMMLFREKVSQNL